MNTIQLEIVTPTRILDEGQVSYVRCPGADGSFGVMANHIEGIIVLDVGEVKVRKDNQDKYLAISGGYAEIMEDRLELLVESVEKSSEIDSERAEMSMERARTRKSEQDPELNEARIEASLARALNRLRVSKR
ncbi:MAG: ATP synthase F1 subunit epsilon [Chloroflexi bacterium]|nr:ATP synthase F1 subunit epsilon [Chloroflexota bacterium]|tara:strand:- start:1323 stop:1721 length:399 start_codon:yes stop_codon:yes gene_type:complete